MSSAAPVSGSPYVAPPVQSRAQPFSARENREPQGQSSPPVPAGGTRVRPFSPGGGAAVTAQLLASQPDNKKSSSPFDLSDEERAVVERLKARDREVRAHEGAHKAAGAGYTGAVSYEYETGPDGKRYAVGGSVDIDTSTVAGDPEATIEKMRVVQSAALAPAKPSGQDRAVAAAAAAKSREAQAEASKLKEEEASKEQAAASGQTDTAAAQTADEAGQTGFALSPIPSYTPPAPQPISLNLIA